MLRRNPAKLDFDLVLFRIPNSRSEFRNYLVYLNKSPIIRFYKLRGTSESPVAFRRYDSDYHLAYIKYYIAKSMTEKETITVKL